jgi:hypothetical protein
MDNNENKSYFHGGFWHLIGLCIGGFIICVITLGLAFPWVCCWFISWQTNHTVIEGKRLHFNGKGINLFGHFILRGWLLGIILTPLTLGLYPVYYYCVSLRKWITKNTSFEGSQTQNTANSNSNSAQINENQNKIISNNLLTSGIIGLVILLLGIVFSLINLRYGFHFSMFINIPIVCGIIAVIFCFVCHFNKINMLPLISGILFCVSFIYTIYNIITLIVKYHFFHYRLLIDFNFLYIIPAILCFLEFAKNKDTNV